MIITKPNNFDLDQIYASGQCFRWEILEHNDYIMPISNMWLRIRCTETELRINNAFLSRRGNAWEYYFDFDTDYSKIETELYHTHDKYLIKCYEHSKGIRILRQDLR